MTARARAKQPLVIPEAVTHRIEIPNCTPPRLNQLMHCHWAVAQKRKNSWTRVVRLFSVHVPEAKGKRRVKLTVTLSPRMRSGDVDAYWKATLDSLVLLSLLVDDNHKWAEIVPVVFERGAERKTVIELEDMES